MEPKEGQIEWKVPQPSAFPRGLNKSYFEVWEDIQDVLRNSDADEIGIDLRTIQTATEFIPQRPGERPSSVKSESKKGKAYKWVMWTTWNLTMAKFHGGVQS